MQTAVALTLQSRGGLNALCPEVIPGTRINLTPITQLHTEIVFKEFTPEITRYMFPAPAKVIDETRAFIDSAVAQRKSSTDFIFTILHKTNDEFLGVCGIHAGKIPHRPEVGLWIKKEAHGQKFGREAIKVLITWATIALHIDGFIYPVDRNNVPSRKIPESLGGKIFEEKIVPTMSGGTLDEVVYLIPPVAPLSVPS